MAKRSIQGYVELASGLGEMTRGAAREAAAELVSLTNAELSPKKVTKQATRLADDLIAAANTNRKNLVSLVRSEVDRAVGRLDVASLQQELSTVTDTVHTLRAQVEELAGTLSGRSARTVSEAALSPAKVVGAVATPDAASGTGASATPSRRPARSALKKTTTTAPASKTAPAKKTSTAKATTTKSAPAKKTSTAKKTTVKKSAATTSTATKSAPAKKASTAKKTTATKSAPAKKASTAKKITATKSAPAKKASTAKKTTTKKASTAKKSTPTKKASTSTSTASGA